MPGYLHRISGFTILRYCLPDVEFVRLGPNNTSYFRCLHSCTHSSHDQYPASQPRQCLIPRRSDPHSGASPRLSWPSVLSRHSAKIYIQAAIYSFFLVFEHRRAAPPDNITLL